jgi:hypothetical protein
MASHVDQVRALLAEAAKLPDGQTKLDLLDEAVRLADLHRDVPLGVAARLPFLHVARNLLRGDRMAIAFAWCLRQYDERPELFNGRNLFDEYAELIGQLANFDAVTRPQLDAMLADLSDRMTRAGLSLGLVWSMKREMAPDVGDRGLSREAMRQLHRLGWGPHLTTANRFYHALFVGDEDEAMRLADRDWLLPGRPLPASSKWFKALILLLKRGRHDELRRWQARATAATRVTDCCYWEYGAIVASLALSGRLADAARLCGQCQRAVREDTDPLTRLHFHLNMLVLFDRLHAIGTESVLVRFHGDVPGRLPSGRYIVSSVRDWMHAAAADLAARFDRRNGTDYYAEQLRDRADWQRYAQPPEDGT